MLPAFIFGANISILVNQLFPTWQMDLPKLWEFVIWTCPRIFSEGEAMKTCKAFSQSVSSKLFVCFIVLFFQNPTTLYIHWFNILLFVGIYIYTHSNTHTYIFRHIVSYIHHIQYIHLFYCMYNIYTFGPGASSLPCPAGKSSKGRILAAVPRTKWMDDL